MLNLSAFDARNNRGVDSKSGAGLDFSRPLVVEIGMTFRSAIPLEIDALRKSYGSLEAVAGVDLNMERGEIFGLLGPNGAGKTSVISTIVTLEKPTSGTIRVFGHDVVKEPRLAKMNVGWVPQEVINHGFFTVDEILVYHAGFYGRLLTEERKSYLLRRLSLWEHRYKKVRELSGGMKRRLMIAKALVHEPQLLLLDEPTAGVDIDLRATLWDFVKELQRDGVSILLTTHYLEEAERLCDRVAFIDHGKIRRVGETHKLVHDLTRKQVIVTLKGPQTLRSHPMLVSQEQNRLTLSLPMQTELGNVLNELDLPMQSILDISILEGTLEDAFRSVLREAK